MHMKNDLRSWIRAAALVASGFTLIADFSLQAQTVDSFDPRLSFIVPGGAHMPADVRGLVVQPDGRFLVGGTVTDINGVTRFDLARFQPGGALACSRIMKTALGFSWRFVKVWFFRTAMITVFSSIMRGEPKYATSTFPSLPAVLSVPILGCLLKYSINFADIVHPLLKYLSARYVV